MADDQENQNKFPETPEVSGTESVPSPVPEDQVVGTSQELTPGALEAPGGSHELMDTEDEQKLLQSPTGSGSSDSLSTVAGQLGELQVKQVRLTTAQRKEALKAKLLESGAQFDPVKWRKGHKERRKRGKQSAKGPLVGPEAGEGSAKRPRGVSATPPSAEGPKKKARGAEATPSKPPESSDGPEAAQPSYREAAACKMAIVLEGFPEAQLTAEQREAIEDALMEKIVGGASPAFAGTYLEKGALVLSCLGDSSRTWLEATMAEIRPLGDQMKLIVGLKKDLIKTVRVHFRAHPRLLKKTPEVILKMLDTQNPSLKVGDWRLLSAKPDPKGCSFVCLVDEVCAKALKQCNYRGNLGLWQVSFAAKTAKKTHAEGTAGEPTSQ